MKNQLIKELYEEDKFVRSDINYDMKYLHTNFLDYLKICWSKHYIPVIKPDFIWQILLTEIGLIIKKDKNHFKHMFTNSGEQKVLRVQSDNLYFMPIEKIVEELSKNIKIDSKLFIPNYSTTEKDDILAFNVALCDTCSPWYRYEMYLCGYKDFYIKGELSDYLDLLKNFKKLFEVLNIQDTNYFSKVTNLLNKIIDNLHDKDFWNKILKFEKCGCGSGSDIEFIGDFKNLFRIVQEPSFIDNFSTCISKIEYKQLDTNLDYKMFVGLFSSRLEDDTLIPNFNYVIYEE